MPEVAARLSVSVHSLYKWVKAVCPSNSEQQSKELLEAKSEILRLRSQMRRVEEGRDLQKSGPVESAQHCSDDFKRFSAAHNLEPMSPQKKKKLVCSRKASTEPLTAAVLDDHLKIARR